MAADHSFAAEDLRLLRRYEPVLRFTRGELFLPMPVPAYLETCALWRSVGSGRTRGRRSAGEGVCAPGEVTPERLAQAGAASGAGDLSLRYVERALNRREYRVWRRTSGRPRLARASSRFAAVGLVGRLIDAVMRLSLLVRGRVPGGTAAAAEQSYRAHAGPARCPYYGHVTRDRGFVALQYWFLYAMNDWRSTFGGVNDHEADWEQVTLFLPDPPDPGDRPAWVAFSSHDEAGDDLRRRHDDPDIEWRGTHPVVFAGAGSHSGAYLPGDYLVTVEPPALRRVLGAARRLSRLLLPWTRDHQGTAFGIPFIDYRRGDGPGVGPGEEREWDPVLVDDTTPWLRDYRGLWGLDTGDPFGGERAPAGPRYERTGAVRACWSDPVGWAGLDKESPTPKAEQEAVEGRMTELDAQIAAAAEELAAVGDELRRVRAGTRALGDVGIRGDPAPLASLETSAEQLRLRRRALAGEREALARASVLGLPLEDPHAHLRHRAQPNVDPGRTRRRVLHTWSAISASFLLAGLAVIVLGQGGALLDALAGLALIMLSVEAFARRHLARFVGGILAAIVVASVAWAVTVAAIGNWREAVAALLALAAL
ncbi:MAG TPA: hypothetical protein VH478_20230, partial [Trebonia sp.]|nr:hypothetical protein [Trebonia sp.]